MPKYLFTGSYTVQGSKGVIAEGGSARVATVTKLMESLGGTLESFYFGFGSDDFYITAEMPSNAAAAAVGLSVAAAGGASVEGWPENADSISAWRTSAASGVSKYSTSVLDG